MQPSDEVPEVLAKLNVYAGGRLVEHDHRRLMNERLGNEHPALHAARERAHGSVRFVGQTQIGENFINPVVISENAPVARLKAQRFTHRQKRVESDFLRHDAEKERCGSSIRTGIHAANENAPARRRGQSAEAGNQRCFAGAVGAEQTEEFAFFNVKTHALQGQSARGVAFFEGVDANGRLCRGHYQFTPKMVRKRSTPRSRSMRSGCVSLARRRASRSGVTLPPIIAVIRSKSAGSIRPRQR